MAETTIPSSLRVYKPRPRKAGKIRQIGRALTAETLRSLVHYDPETGDFTWLRRPEIDQWASMWNTKWAGKRAGNYNMSIGYRTIGIFDERYLAHRLAYLYMTGEWPAEVVDHINMNRGDNRWANLRAASHSENKYNRTILSNNQSGHKGVYFHKASERWHALITHAGRKISLGYYQSAALAGAAYQGAERALRGDWILRDALLDDPGDNLS
jgi:hypothetical protein